MSDPDKEPAHKRQRGEAAPPPIPPPRSLSDPSQAASSMDALIQAAGSRPRTGPSLDGALPAPPPCTRTATHLRTGYYATPQRLLHRARARGRYCVQCSLMHKHALAFGFQNRVHLLGTLDIWPDQVYIRFADRKFGCAAGSGSSNRLGSISSDEGFPGHNSVEDAYGDSNVVSAPPFCCISRVYLCCIWRLQSAWCQNRVYSACLTDACAAHGDNVLA